MLLKEKDRVCFQCSLIDCIEKSSDCKRKNFLKETREYKRSLKEKRFKTELKLQEPILVR